MKKKYYLGAWNTVDKRKISNFRLKNAFFELKTHLTEIKTKNYRIRKLEFFLWMCRAHAYVHVHAHFQQNFQRIKKWMKKKDEICRMRLSGCIRKQKVIVT